MQNWAILALAIPEYHWASRFKVGHVTLTTPLLRMICHSYAGTWHSLPNLCTQFDDCSLSRSRDMVGAHQNVSGSRDLTKPLFTFYNTYYRKQISAVIIKPKSKVTSPNSLSLQKCTAAHTVCIFMHELRLFVRKKVVNSVTIVRICVCKVYAQKLLYERLWISAWVSRERFIWPVSSSCHFLVIGQPLRFSGI